MFMITNLVIAGNVEDLAEVWVSINNSNVIFSGLMM